MDRLQLQKGRDTQETCYGGYQTFRTERETGYEIKMNMHHARAKIGHSNSAIRKRKNMKSNNACMQTPSVHYLEE